MGSPADICIAPYPQGPPVRQRQLWSSVTPSVLCDVGVDIGYACLHAMLAMSEVAAGRYHYHYQLLFKTHG
jgi:hypothetical protein